MLPNLKTVVDLLRYRAIHQTHQTAYTFLVDGETEEVSITYQELDIKARELAAYLQCLNIGGIGGKKALLLYQPGLEYIIAFFACLYAGIVAIPAYPPRLNKPTPRLQAIVANAQAKIALTNNSTLNNFEELFRQNPHLAALHWIATDSLTEILTKNLSEEWQQPKICSDTMAFLQYTSGSTGEPKGVMVSHGNLLHNSELIHQCFENTPQSRGVIWLPPYHDMGLIGGILQAAYCGGSVVIMSPLAFVKKPVRWLQAISHYKATTSGGPDFAYNLCVRKITPEQRATLDLSSWEVAFTGAEPVRAETLENFARTFEPCGFRKEAFYPCYGMAEATLIISGGLKAQAPIISQVNKASIEQNQVVITTDKLESRAIVGCGRTWINQRIAIVNPESLTLCPPDQVGEIWVLGDSVAQGYWNQSEYTEKIFHAYLTDTGEGPFLRTGDLGFLQDGELFVTGRLKDLMIICGRNHYPQDIELTAEQSHPALAPGCGVAFSIEIANQEKLVIAQEVERHYLRKLNIDEVIKAIVQAVSEQHDLQAYAVLLLKTGSIPKTSSGKVRRSACRADFLAGNLDVVADWSINPQYKVEFRSLSVEVESLLQQLQKGQQHGELVVSNKTYGIQSDRH